MRALLLVSVLLLAPLAGCLATGGKTITLRDGLSDAQDAAKAWANGETLHFLGGSSIEPFKHLNYTDRNGKLVGEEFVHVDPVPGDGRSASWAYEFLAGDRCVGVLLAAGLGIVVEGWETCKNHNGITPLDGWAVDSDQVATLLAKRSDWPQQDESNTYAWDLGMENGHPLWTIAVHRPNDPTVYATVAADNGTVLSVTSKTNEVNFGSVQAGNGGSGAQAGDHGTQTEGDSSTLLKVGDTVGSQVTLKASGSLHLGYSITQAITGVHVRVTGPSGQVEAFDSSTSGERDYTDLPPGDYSVAMTTDGAAMLVREQLTANW